MSGPDRFTVTSGACQLAARSYVPEANAFPGAGVVMVHGLLSSADIYDVPGLEPISLARQLQSSGLSVVSYDQRGAGDSTADDWHFGLREHAQIDLPAVLAECRSRLGFERVVLVGHSLGGTIWLRCVESIGAVAQSANLPQVIGGVAIASPADFDRTFPPWSDIARRGRAFVESIDHDNDLIVRREEFTAAQVWLYWPWAKRLFPPSRIGASMRAGAESARMAGVLRRLPIPSLIYHRDDFDDETFQRVLQSKALDCASEALMLELADEIAAPLEAPPPIALRVLCIGSTQDRLVPLRTVEGFGRRFTDARVIDTKRAYGHAAGHVGYFFKAGVQDRVRADVLEYLRATL